jgi:putative flavoprotein involved in K+ transport
VPRRYRGVDILRWLERMGDLDRNLVDAADPRAGEPSLQLSGRAGAAALELGTQQAGGVRLVGRLESIVNKRLIFGTDLASTLAGADARMRRLLDRIDLHIAQSGRPVAFDRDVVEPVTAGPTRDAADLGPRGIRSVVWATGFRRSYPWLHLPVFDHRGEIVHHRGVTMLPGCYTMGMRFQSRRRSTFIDGVRFDAAEIAAHLLARERRANPPVLVDLAS